MQIYFKMKRSSTYIMIDSLEDCLPHSKLIAVKGKRINR